MEDSPGDVTCEAEELISALEEEVRSMRIDLNVSAASGAGIGAGTGAGSDLQGPNSKGRTGPWGPGGWRDDRDRCRQGHTQGQGQGYGQGQGEGEDEVKETSRDRFSPHGLTDSGASFRSPQPPTHPAGGLIRDEANPVSRKDMTAGRLNQQKKGSSYVPALRHMAQRSGSDSHDEHTHGALILDHINDGRVKDCPTASTLSPDTKITGDGDGDGDGEGQGYDEDAYEDDFQAPEFENKVEQKDDVSVLTSTDAGSKIMGTVLLSAHPREAHTATSTVLDGFKKGFKGDSNGDQSPSSHPLIPASASVPAAAVAVSAPQVYPTASQPVNAPPALRPTAKGPPSLAEIRRIKDEKLMQQEKEEKERADSAPPVTMPVSVQAHVHVPSSSSVTDSVSSSNRDRRGQGEEVVDSYSQQQGKNENGAKNQYFRVPQIQAEETGGYVPSSQARVKRNDVLKEKIIVPEREVFYGKETRKEKEKDTDEMYCPVKIKDKVKDCDRDDDDSDDDYFYKNVKQNKDPVAVEKPSWNTKKKENEKEKEEENERVKEQDEGKEKEKKRDNWNKNVKSWDVEKDKVIDRNEVEKKDEDAVKEKEKEKERITEKERHLKGGNYDEKIPSKKPGSFFAYGNSKKSGNDDDDEYEFNGSDDEIA